MCVSCSFSLSKSSPPLPPPILSLILFFLILFLYLSLIYRGEHCYSSRADLVIRLSYTQVNQHQFITHTQTSSVQGSTPININHHTHKQVLGIYQSPLLSFIHSSLEGPTRQNWQALVLSTSRLRSIHGPPVLHPVSLRI